MTVAGSMATFHCKATSDRSLNLTVDWLADGMPIHFDNGSRFSKSDDFSMTITEITESDAKTYMCLAKTELDNVTVSAKLIIQVPILCYKLAYKTVTDCVYSFVFETVG